ncbi:MAG: hypothetical protein V2I65_10670 [Paracoccaceae bacterium]|nr:hypothetical protein [Paracoccaceae bacterium]
MANVLRRSGAPSGRIDAPLPMIERLDGPAGRYCRTADQRPETGAGIPSPGRARRPRDPVGVEAGGRRAEIAGGVAGAGAIPLAPIALWSALKSP